jgi:hypothetical protein
MTDSEAAAWTRGHAVGQRELKAAEQRWQVERAELKAEVEECDRLRERMGELLTATAAALRGQPAPLTLYDWSSIPDRTAAVVNALCGATEYAIELRAEIERLRADAERYRSVVQSVAVTELHKLPSGDECICTRCELALEARAAIDAARDALKEKQT